MYLGKHLYRDPFFILFQSSSFSHPLFYSFIFFFILFSSSSSFSLGSHPSFSSLIPYHLLLFLFHSLLVSIIFPPPTFTSTFSNLVQPFSQSISFFLYYPAFFISSPFLAFSLLLPDKPSTNEEHSLV